MIGTGPGITMQCCALVLNLLVCDLSEVVLIHLFMAKTKKFSEMKFVLI